jgi:hypothetical protein
MKRVLQFQVTFMSFFILLFLHGNNCNAIPAFARKYQISCQVCHSPAVPRLKAFGDEFSGNGFRMTEFESPRYFIPAGDDKLSLLRELPLAIRMDGFVSYNFNDEGKTDFASPFILKIISGGELSDKLSYYFYFLFNETGSIAGAEDVFLVYHDMLNSGINITLGQFSVSDPLFKNELRLTLEPYKIYGVVPGNSSTDLKYDRGVIFDKGFKTGTTLVAEIVNGCGIGEAGEGYLFDKDKYKNIMLRVNQSIGKKLSVGIMGYSGKELLTDPGMVFSEMTNEIKMIGPDLSVNFDEKFILNFQYVFRNDSQVFPSYGGTPMTNINTRGGFAEIIYSPKGDNSKWYLAGIINEVNSNLGELDYTSATLHAGYLLRRNVRLVTEYTQVVKPESFGRVNVGFVTAF